MTVTTTPLLDAYEEQLVRVRENSINTVLKRVLELDTNALKYFLLHFCGVGVHLTEPVEGWITRAGESCVAQGYTDLGKNLIKHAKHEADHHLMYIADLEALVKLWGFSEKPQSFYEGVIPTSALPYRKLHEDVIKSDRPYGQIAIEYEIELISIAVGPLFVKHVHDKLGVDVVKALTFINSHISFDKGHTKLNRKNLNKLLVDYPDCLDQLIHDGTAALNTWWSSFNSCIDMALSH